MLFRMKESRKMFFGTHIQQKSYFCIIVAYIMNKVIGRKVDIMGIVASGLCAIHCAALPILFSLGVLGGASSSAWHHSAELGVLILSLALASWSSYRGWKSHRLIGPQVLIAAGISVIVLGFFIATDIDHRIMAVGGVILVLGHAYNHRLQNLTN